MDIEFYDDEVEIELFDEVIDIEFYDDEIEIELLLEVS